jgi:hypothetical protein
MEILCSTKGIGENTALNFLIEKRRVTWLMATRVIISNDLSRGYFYKIRNEWLPYKMAVLATAHKLIRIMFVMLSRKTFFVEGGIKYS